MSEKMLKFKEFSSWLNEQTIPVEIGKEVVGHIAKSDQDAINKITKIAGSASSKGAVIDFFIGIGYPNQQANFLFDVLMHGSDMQKLSTYFSNRTNKVEDFIGSVIDSYTINSTLGIDKKTSLEFFNFSWRTSPAMGPGEVYLSTIFDGGRRPGTKDKGDVIVNGAELEVKGSGARLVGQHGYGDAKLMRKAFNHAMAELAKELKIKNFTVEDNGTDSFWNITKKDARGLEINLKKIASEVGGFKPRDILLASSMIVTAYTTYLKNLDFRSKAGTFEKSIGRDGSINVVQFNRSLLELYYNYYYENEKFTYFCMTDSKGLFLIIKPTDFMSYYDKGIIKVSAPPSFTDGAGSQGGSFAIGLK
jgi:hypothetical protein